MPNEQIEMIERMARAIESGNGDPDTFKGAISRTALRDARVAYEALTPRPDTGQGEQGNGVPASPSGCQPTASAPLCGGSSRSGIPNAEQVARVISNTEWDNACSALGTPNCSRGSGWERFLPHAVAVLSTLERQLRNLTKDTVIDRDNDVIEGDVGL